MKRKYNEIRGLLFLSFYSVDFYRDVGRNWKGIGFFYLLLVIGLLLLPTTTKLASGLNAVSDREASSVVKSKGNNLVALIISIADQLPEMRMTNNELLSLTPGPHNITGYGGRPLAVIDTSGSITAFNKIEAPILITKDNILFRFDENSIQKVTIPDLAISAKLGPGQEVAINRDSFLQWISDKSLILSVMFFLIMLFSYSLSFSLSAILFAGIGILLARFMKADLGLKALFRLSFISSTAYIALEMLSLYLDKKIFANEGLIYPMLHFAYLFYAVEANKGKN